MYAYLHESGRVYTFVDSPFKNGLPGIKLHKDNFYTFFTDEEGSLRILSYRKGYVSNESNLNWGDDPKIEVPLKLFCQLEKII